MRHQEMGDVPAIDLGSELPPVAQANTMGR